MKRRSLIAALGLVSLMYGVGANAQSAAPAPGLNPSTSGVVLVEVANFHCPVCRVVNDHYERIRQSAAQAGVAFHFAPVTWDNHSPWPDRVYYATRDVAPAVAGLVREYLFDGVQRELQRFEDLSQVIAYLERRSVPELALKLDPNFSLANVAQRAATDDTVLSGMKAGRLLVLTHAERVPAFAWVKDGEVIDTVFPAEGEEPHSVVTRVLRKLTPQ